MSRYGFGHGIPQSGRDVAEAFYAGKRKIRTNCETEGEYYCLLGTAIARRLNVPSAVARALEGLHPNPTQLPCESEFSYGGYGSKLTARHLCALGIDAAIIDREPCFNGVPVGHHEWFTKAEIAALVRVPMPPKAPRGKFVNLTAELFPA